MIFNNIITYKDEREFKGIWCDAHLWFYSGLNVMEKMFYLEIKCLDNEYGCFATNEHFARFSGLSKSRSSEIIKSLQEKGAITVELAYKVRYHKLTKQIDRRVIRIVPEWENAIREAYEKQKEEIEQQEDPYVTYPNTYGQSSNSLSGKSDTSSEKSNITEKPNKAQEPNNAQEPNKAKKPSKTKGKSDKQTNSDVSPEKSSTYVHKSKGYLWKPKRKEYNIYNTYINNNNKKTTSNKKVVVVKDDCDITKQVIESYKNYFGKKPAPIILKQISALLLKFEWDAIEHAFAIAGRKGKLFDYARGIIRKWQEHDAYTIDAIYDYDEMYAGRLKSTQETIFLY